VQMAGGRIYRNEVYFDTLHLITAIRDWNARKTGASDVKG
jgi:hypothetical protein